MHRGFIKLYRKTVDWEWYKNPNVKSVFIHLLFKANHKDKKWQGIDVKRGEAITSILGMVEELGMSIQQIRTSLNKLKKTKEIIVKNNAKHLHISVCNYETYGCEQLSDNTEITLNQHSDNFEVTTTKNVYNPKKEKNDKNLKYIVEIIDYLNFSLQTNFKASTNSTIKDINGRISDGHTVSDFKEVIDHKKQQWTGIEQQQYLRPSTLFRASNFENYLNDARRIKPTQQNNSFNRKLDTQEIINKNNRLVLE